MENKTDPSGTQSPADSSAGEPTTRRRSKKRSRGKSYSRVRVKRNGAISLEGYTPEQRHVINQLSLGSSVDSAMESVKKSRSCFYKWAKKDTIFGAIAQHARAVHQAAIDDAFHEAESDARRLLHRIIVDENVSPATRLRAALACLNRKSGSWLPHELPPYRFEPEFTEDELHCRLVNPAPEDDGPGHDPGSEPNVPAGHSPDDSNEAESATDPAAETASSFLAETGESVEFENEASTAANRIETKPRPAENTPKFVNTKNAKRVEFCSGDADAESWENGSGDAPETSSPPPPRLPVALPTASTLRYDDPEAERACEVPSENAESVEFQINATAMCNSIENQSLTVRQPPQNAYTKNAECVESYASEATATTSSWKRSRSEPPSLDTVIGIYDHTSLIG